MNKLKYTLLIKIDWHKNFQVKSPRKIKVCTIRKIFYTISYFFIEVTDGKWVLKIHERSNLENTRMFSIPHLKKRKKSLNLLLFRMHCCKSFLWHWVCLKVNFSNTVIYFFCQGKNFNWVSRVSIVKPNND